MLDERDRELLQEAIDKLEEIVVCVSKEYTPFSNNEKIDIHVVVVKSDDLFTSETIPELSNLDKDERFTGIDYNKRYTLQQLGMVQSME